MSQIKSVVVAFPRSNEKDAISRLSYILSSEALRENQIKILNSIMNDLEFIRRKSLVIYLNRADADMEALMVVFEEEYFRARDLVCKLIEMYE